YLARLKETRDFVLCGDINIAHQEIDLKNFKGNKKNSGFLPEERAWMSELLAPTLPASRGLLPPEGAALARGGPSLRASAEAAEDALEELTDGTGQPSLKAVRGGGMVDVYRKLQPTATDEAYTWWSNRGQAYAKNVGWRLDYHLATPAVAALAQSETIYREQRFSDHAPITVDYALTL
ncbi:MAG: endonuclease/exonuclease/phosphatase family protein, partial [Polaromonas sp.]